MIQKKSPQEFVERLRSSQELAAYPDHLARYRFAMQWAPRGEVLDLGCGCGYGSRILAAAGAARVSALDVSSEALESARREPYPANLTFYLGNGKELPVEIGSSFFDLITCFEVLEHIPDPQNVIGQIRDRLRPDGIALLSTPNGDAYAGGHSGNPFHPSEMGSRKFRELVERFFGRVAWYAQVDNAAIWKRPAWQRSLIRLLRIRRNRPTEISAPVPAPAASDRLNVHGIDDWYPVPWDTVINRMYEPPPPLILAICQDPRP